MRKWLEWCEDDPAAVSLLVADGPGGCGKTRLALQAARRLVEVGWRAGWLKDGRAAELVAAAAVVPDPVLVLIDDADTRTDLPALLADLSGYEGTGLLRVVLIARHSDELEAALQSRSPSRHAAALGVAQRMSLEPLGEQGDLVRWYGEAVEAFTAALQVQAPRTSVTVAPVRQGQMMVEVLAAAMVAVLTHSPPDASAAPLGEVAEALFQHEAGWWAATARQERWAIRDATNDTLADVLAALVLFTPQGEEAAASVLRRIPELADASQERVRYLVRWARALYPPTVGPMVRIGPDLLVDWFITHRLTRDDHALARNLLTGLDEDQAARALTVLARAGEHHPPAHLLFQQLLGGDPVRLARHAVYAALTTGRRAQLDHTTAQTLTDADLDPDTIALLQALLPAHALPRTALALARHHLHHTRTNGTTTDFANALTDLSVALSRIGQHMEQLDVAREAVALHRQAAADNPTHQPNLARALANLGAALDEVGQHTEQLKVTREAVALYRQIAADNPTHQHNLANALTDLSVALSRIGQHMEQLDVAREAVALHRQAAADNPTHQHNLANALTNLGAALERIGQYTEQLDVAREAVALHRQAAADNPTHQPGLARALADLSIALGRIGQHMEQLDVAREAVALYRQAAADNPAHQHNLANTLADLSVALNEFGQHMEQLDVAREAVALHRQAAADNPTHQPGLARALANLGAALDEVGQHTEQLKVTRETVALYRQIAAENPAHQHNLADALAELSVALSEVGQHTESLEVVREAVALYRQVAADNPVHQHNLARALANLSVALSEVGQHTESLGVKREMVGVWRELAEWNPNLYRQAYLDHRGELQRQLAQLGEERDAIALDLPDAPNDNELDEEQNEDPADGS
ncbi:tetratricopeptide repeat protein [Actinocorallia aurantiaca]|uniref:tetratricopeptide repeat protein n=1 Tax=Actinocorallia aurantiaca TaxID=46204 RepID=UPI0031D6A13B